MAMTIGSVMLSGRRRIITSRCWGNWLVRGGRSSRASGMVVLWVEEEEEEMGGWDIELS